MNFMYQDAVVNELYVPVDAVVNELYVPVDAVVNELYVPRCSCGMNFMYLWMQL